MSTKPIKKVTVVGGSGSAGAPIVRALLDAKFEVSVLSRASSKASFQEGVNVIRTEYTHEKLVAALKGQDAVVSTITTFSVGDQRPLIDAAVAAGVRRFLPSEYGVDTSDLDVGVTAPPAGAKTETVAYLRTKESAGMSWSAIIVGAFFDAMFRAPTVLGVNLPARSMTVFDGGDIEFEATNVAQIGRTVAAVLSFDHLDETANQYVYVNSFTTTQNKMLKAFEEVGGVKLKTSPATMEDFSNAAQSKISSDPDHGPAWHQGVFEAIILIMLNHRGFCEYSKTKGLWNKKLGLPEEKLEDTIEAILAEHQLKA